MRKLAILGFVFLLAGCASLYPSSITSKSLKETQQLMSEPTPSDWEVGSLWNFVKRGHDGATIWDVTVRVTDRSTRTCSSGDWRALELVEGKAGDEPFELKTAYNVEGRLLMLDFTGWCDVGEIQGVLSDATFEGNTTRGGIHGGYFKPVKVVGHRLR